MRREKLEFSPVFARNIPHRDPTTKQEHMLGYIRLANFSQKAAHDMDAAIHELQVRRGVVTLTLHSSRPSQARSSSCSDHTAMLFSRLCPQIQACTSSWLFPSCQARGLALLPHTSGNARAQLPCLCVRVAAPDSLLCAAEGRCRCIHFGSEKQPGGPGAGRAGHRAAVAAGGDGRPQCGGAGCGGANRCRAGTCSAGWAACRPP